MTRPAAAAAAAAARAERRVIGRASIGLELTGRPGEPLGFAARPSYGTVGFADLTRPGEPPPLRHLRSLVTDKVDGAWHDARAELTFLDVPREELVDLRLRRPLRASAGWLGVTITGAAEP
jgi:hypothetical protein